MLKCSCRTKEVDSSIRETAVQVQQNLFFCIGERRVGSNRGLSRIVGRQRQEGAAHVLPVGRNLPSGHVDKPAGIVRHELP